MICLALPGRAQADPVLRLIQILKDAGDYKQRVAAAIALARRQDLRAVPQLLASLHDRHPTVRGVVASVLGKLGDPRAKRPLAALSRRATNGFVKEQVQRAMATLAAALKPQRAPGQNVPPGRRQKNIYVAGTLGSLDQHSIQEGINAALPAASNCFNQQFQSAPYLKGKVSLKFRITTSGSVKWVFLQRSDLGSLAAEQCILQTMKRARFSRPQGGEAEFTIPLNFGGGDPVRLLDQRSLIARRLQKNCNRLLKNGRQALAPPSGMMVSLYVEAGKVVSAGLSADGLGIDEPFAKSFVANLKQFKLNKAGGGVAKLSYPFVCSPTR